MVNKKNFKIINLIILTVIISIGHIVAVSISNDSETEDIVNQVETTDNEDITIDGIDVYYDDASASVYYDGLKNNPDYKWLNIQQKNKNGYNVKKELENLEGSNILLIEVTYNNAYMVKASIPNKSDIDENQADELVEELKTIINNYKYASIYASESEIEEANKEYNINIETIGAEEKNFISLMIAELFPTFYNVLIFFLLIMYSKNITTSLSTERNSKIIEMLTSYARPKTLIRGKLIGNILIGLMQIVSLIIAAVLSVVLGNKVHMDITGKNMVDIDKFVSFIRDFNTEGALTNEEIIVSILLIISSIVLFDILAGIFGTFVGKPEDASVITNIYTYTIMIGYFLALMAGDNEVINNILKYVPICIPFKIPVDVLVGTASVQEGLISLIIMILSSGILFVLMGNIYEKLVFKAFSFKDILSKWAPRKL